MSNEKNKSMFGEFINGINHPEGLNHYATFGFQEKHPKQMQWDLIRSNVEGEYQIDKADLERIALDKNYRDQMTEYMPLMHKIKSDLDAKLLAEFYEKLKTVVKEELEIIGHVFYRNSDFISFVKNRVSSVHQEGMVYTELRLDFYRENKPGQLLCRYSTDIEYEYSDNETTIRARIKRGIIPNKSNRHL